MDGTIAKINTTLLNWLGLDRREVVGRMRFTDLLTVGGKLYHETHFAPLLQMQGEVSGIALDIKAAGRQPAAGAGHLEGEDRRGRRAPADPHHRLRRPRPPRLREGAPARAARRPRSPREAERTAWPGARRPPTVLQQSLLPAALPDACPGMEAAAYYHTASPDQLGGDFYDLFPLAATAGRSSSATCAARAPRPPRSPP